VTKTGKIGIRVHHVIIQCKQRSWEIQSIMHLHSANGKSEHWTVWCSYA